VTRTGRPRSFDHDAALDGAMFLFWDRGYDGVSVDHLREAMGNLSTASIYATFGSKPELFRKALDRYAKTYGRVTAPLFDETLQPQEAIERTLRGSADMQTGDNHPPGCMVALSATLYPPSAADLALLVSAERQKNRIGIRRCVERDVRMSKLPASDIEAIATLYEGFLLGISTQVRDGVSPLALSAAITAIMSCWGPLADR